MVTQTMNWDDVRVFLSLSREGTFAGAGRALGVNATTVARRLTAFEDAMQTQLFTRTRDGLVPTAAAEQMRGTAELVERQMLRIERSVGGEDARLAGRVRVSLTQNLACHFLVDRMTSFRREHKDIELELNTTDTMVDLTRGEADLVIRHRSPNTGSGVEATGHVEVLAQRLAPIAFAVFASRRYLERVGVPAAVDDVAGHDAVLPRGDAMYLPGSGWAREVAGKLRSALRTDSLAAMQVACTAGFGLCVLPCFPGVYTADVVRVTDPVDTRDTWLLMPGDLRRVARVRALWDHLVELFAAWGPMLSGQEVPPARDARPRAET